MPSLLLLAAVMATPQADDPSFWKAVYSGLGMGSIMAEVFVAPDGTVEDCAIDYSQLSKSQSAKFCANAMRLKLTKPATGPDGKPAYGVFPMSRIIVETITSSPSSTPPSLKFQLPPDLELTVAGLPKQYRNSLRVGLTVMIDDRGAVVACSGDDEAPADYAAAACDQVKMLKLRMRQNAAGSAVPYVGSVAVQFTVPKS